MYRKHELVAGVGNKMKTSECVKTDQLKGIRQKNVWPGNHVKWNIKVSAFNCGMKMAN